MGERHAFQRRLAASRKYCDQRKYRTDENDQRRSVFRRGLELELSFRLSKGELQAFGIRSGAPLVEGPVRIPAQFFPSNSEDDGDIDWDQSSLAAAGHKFVSVRVCKATEVTAAHQKNERDQAKAKRRGRPSISAQLIEIVSELNSCKKFEGISQKQQFHLTRIEARKKYPNIFRTTSQPSDQSIRKSFKHLGLISLK